MLERSIGIVHFSPRPAGITPLVDLSEVLLRLYSEVTVIAEEGSVDRERLDPVIGITSVSHTASPSLLGRVLQYIRIQTRISREIYRLRHQLDEIIFFIGGDTLLLPILTSKTLGMKTHLLFGAPHTINMEINEDSLQQVALVLSRLSLKLVDTILVYSNRFIDLLGLEEYSHKVKLGIRHFPEATVFRESRSLEDRDLCVGYVGRLDSVKNVDVLIKAMVRVRNAFPKAHLLIVGEGPMREKLKAMVRERGLHDSVSFRGWVDHDDLPELYNEMKLFVNPSSSEGIPNAMLEAMACGTPVAVTPVGGIPDWIRHGSTGYILDEVSPTPVAKHLIEALSDPDLPSVARSGKRVIEASFTLEAAVKRYRNALSPGD